jgi:hypothetical protein
MDSKELLVLIGKTILAEGEERLLAQADPTSQTLVLILHTQCSRNNCVDNSGLIYNMISCEKLLQQLFKQIIFNK